MKEFDRFNKENLSFYNDTVYKVININRVIDVGLRKNRENVEYSYMMDQSVINNEENYDGYYAAATN